MPIYEFHCPANNKLYSFLVRSQAHGQIVPLCPDNPDWPMEKRVSAFSITGNQSDEKDPELSGDVDDARMEELLQEMETGMSYLNETNPNPKQIGHLMRKITETMGNKAPPEMQSLVRRLEAGEQPEKLESELREYQTGEDNSLLGEIKKLIHHFNTPIRDPMLYEIQDYLPKQS